MVKSVVWGTWEASRAVRGVGVNVQMPVDFSSSTAPTLGLGGVVNS